jgi:PAS domain S-box-containing protein
MPSAPKKKRPFFPAPTESILESISDGVFTVDLDWRVTSFNRAAENITGIPRKQAIGRPCPDVFRSSMCENECALRRTLAHGRPIIGKTGYIVDRNGERIPVSVSTAVLRDRRGRVVGGAETFRDLSEIEILRRELEGRFRVNDFLSRSPEIRKIFEILPTVAQSPSTVLILGETGTGKELMARTVHSLSGRRDAPFVALHCAALPDTLLESELFGYKKGAFTGAERDKPGRFALARGGTLFLDEIGDISPALQVRLLRVLQEKTFDPLGATRPEYADVRLIVATHRDLSRKMREGTFREDLFYRINVVRVELPPLRKRKEDIPLLADHFVRRFNRLRQKSIEGVSPEALSLMMAHDWPGNIRELENTIERAFILCPEGVIGIEHLPGEWKAPRHRRPARSDMRNAKSLAEFESIRTALERHGGSRLEAARELGIHKSTLHRKIRALRIPLPPEDGRSRRGR